MNAPHGPYDTWDAPYREAEHVYDAALAHPDAQPPISFQINAGLLMAALKQAGVETGEYDHVIAGWLAGWEPEVVQVVIGWVERARAAADSALRAEINTLRAQIDSLETGVRRAAPIQIDFDTVRHNLTDGDAR